MQKIFFNAYSLFLVLSLSCCTQRGQTVNENIPTNISTPNSSTNCPAMQIMAPKWKRYWETFTSKESVRIAGPKDFNFLSAVVDDKYLILDIKNWMRCPSIYGDFNGDGVADELAAFVLDTNESDQKGMSFVIIDATGISDNETEDRPHIKWIQRNSNLTQSMLTYSRSGLAVKIIKSDGSVVVRQVYWNKLEKEFQLE